MKQTYKNVFQTEEGREVYLDLLKRLGYDDTLSRKTERDEMKAIALYDFAIELKRLVESKDEL